VLMHRPASTARRSSDVELSLARAYDMVLYSKLRIVSASARHLESRVLTTALPGSSLATNSVRDTGPALTRGRSMTALFAFLPRFARSGQSSFAEASG
jgi:hypothetical protein